MTPALRKIAVTEMATLKQTLREETVSCGFNSRDWCDLDSSLVAIVMNVWVI